jgi:hypothetical protein
MAMRRTSPARFVLAATALALACTLAAGGCAAPPASGPAASQSTATATAEPTVAPPAFSSKPPAPADLATPQSAVRSYLDWISYAYRIAVSDVASHTASPGESVRVDSYVQYNLQERNRRIDQQMVKFMLRKEAEKDSRATVSAIETWDYRYLSASGKLSMSPTYTTSYETTYTLVRTGDGWVVDSVKAKPLDEVK